MNALSVIAMSVLMLVVMIAVFGGIMFVLTLTAKPKGADLAYLESSAPGEQVIDYRVCNAIVIQAEIGDFTRLVLNAVGLETAVDLSVGLVRKLARGLWVGGRVILTTDRVVFMPNALNRAVQSGLSVIALNLRDVSTVTERYGVVTRIIDIGTASGTLTVRCARSRQLADAIEAARTRA